MTAVYIWGQNIRSLLDIVLAVGTNDQATHHLYFLQPPSSSHLHVGSDVSDPALNSGESLQADIQVFCP